VEEKFAIALSERGDEDAIREVSLKIKLVFPKTPKVLLVFFTPHYQPGQLLKNIALTLKPQVTIGIQAPFLIYEDKIIEKGVVGCCINKEELDCKGFFIKSGDPEGIEATMWRATKDFSKEKQFFLSFISSHFNPIDCLRGFELSLGKIFNVISAGFLKQYAAKNYQLINDTVDEGLAGVMLSGIEVTSLRLGGFLPLGKPFTLTKVKTNRGLIMEIDNKPAISIYKHYLEEKFDVFSKNRLFTLYPLGVRYGNQLRLVYIADYLDDGSLAYIGEVKENAQGHLMLFHPPSLLTALKKELNLDASGAWQKREGFAFIINSTIRKKILKDYAYEETRLIKNQLGEKMKVIGIYSDYVIFPDAMAHTAIVEAGSPIITFWQ
jgi:hypothetical protein